MANFVIDSVKRLKEKLEMIDSLSEIEIATKILAECDEDNDEVDTLNSHYKKLNCEIKSMDRTVRFFLNQIFNQ
jgi:poly [ADP-ribose] polymerase